MRRLVGLGFHFFDHPAPPFNLACLAAFAKTASTRASSRRYFWTTSKASASSRGSVDSFATFVTSVAASSTLAIQRLNRFLTAAGLVESLRGRPMATRLLRL